MPCSGLNSATSVTPGRAREQVDRALAVARPSGVVREQADALAAQPREPFGGEHVDAGEDRFAWREVLWPSVRTAPPSLG